MSSQRQVIDSPGARKADLAAIHIAKAELGWDDDHYRDILWSVCRVRSSALLDFTGRKLFLAHLRACGWSGGGHASAKAKKAATRPISGPLSAQQRLMWSLWQQLADDGKVQHRGMGALSAYAKRQTGVDRLEWLKPKQEDLVIECLKKWLGRA